MGWIEYHKPVMVMLVLQFTYAGVSLSAKASFLQGMSPRVFVVYRQAFGTLFIAPIAYFSRSKTARCSMGWKSFSLIFIASLIGVTGNQMIQYEGIYLASSSAASALSNLIPAITFVAASIVGVIGAFGIIIGLYIVLWGKAKDVEQLKEEQEKLTMISQNDRNRIVQIMVDGSSLAEPLLPNKNNEF
ncbi:Drug/metabolite transporter [Artemisia annua]|uniref:WAT1-related protein n=1 Tax=Artemisia annua TaxID=35608 RepID=A0A2U1KVA1_ARTAN|nr:Drug/metabolite transporter [Artemisia annua]